MTDTNVTEVDRLALLHLVAERVGFQAGLAGTDIPWAEVTSSLPTLANAHGVVTLAYEAPSFHLVPRGASEQLGAMAALERRRGMGRLASQARILATLQDAGIPTLVLKGQAFSALTFGHWASRGDAGDLDLLVAASDMERTEEALVDLGFTPYGGGPVPEPGSRLARYALWLHYERGWVSADLGRIDLHWRALPGGAAWNTGEHLLRHAVDVELPIGRVKTLGPAEALIVACAQGQSENWSRLKRLADVAAIQGVCSPVDLTGARATSRLVAPSLAQLGNRWHQLPSLPPAQMSTTTSIPSLWQMRMGSGSLWDAAARSALGVLAPARKLTWKDQPA